MPEAIIDLRSDTVTRPTPAMRAAMNAAEVGDDVFHEDPTVNRLEERVAALLGKEAALFVPSGTMSNQIGVKAHTQPGDELLCDANCHIYNYEAGGPAVLSGVTCRTLDGDYGILDVSQLSDKIRPINDHLVRTRLVCLENTHNRGGGRVYPLEKIQAISAWTHANGLTMHLDGARLWNAVVATGTPARAWARAVRHRVRLFQQGAGRAGRLGPAPGRATSSTGRGECASCSAAACARPASWPPPALYALDHHVERLAEDHRNAAVIAQAIADTPGLRLDPPEVETNLIWFEVDPDLGTAGDVAAALKGRGVLVHAAGPQTLRACTHLDVSAAQAERAAEVVRRAVAQMTPAR